MKATPARKASWRFWRRREGTAAAEFVLILPVVGVLLFGVIEIGRMLHDYQVISKGVRNGTRYLTRMPMSCAGSNGSFDNAADENDGKNMATTGNPAGGTLLLGYFNASQITVTKTCASNAGSTFAGVYNGYTDIPQVTMQAVVPFTFLFGEYLIPGTGTINMTVAHSEVNIGE